MPRAVAKAVSVSRPDQNDERPAHFVQSLERGFQILRAFDREHPSMTVSEVASRTGLTRGTAQRFLLTLVDLGYAEHDGKRFGLRPKVLDLGFAYLASNDVWDTVEPFVEEVVNELNESCTVGVLISIRLFSTAISSIRRLLRGRDIPSRTPGSCGRRWRR